MDEIDNSPPADQRNIFERIVAVSRKVDHIVKGETTKAAGQYAYRGVDRVLNEFGPVLRQEGVFVAPRVKSLQHRDIKTSGGKDAHEVIVEVEYVFYGEMGDSVMCSAYGESADSNDKATPQAMSVALRTAYLQMFTVPTGDPDPDENDVKRGGKAAKPPALSDEERRALSDAGWASLADKEAGWAWIVDALSGDSLSPAIKDAMKEYGKKLGLDPQTFTREQGVAWNAEAQRLIDAEQAPSADDLNAGARGTLDGLAQAHPGEEPFS